jgi:hypothetical protein
MLTSLLTAAETAASAAFVPTQTRTVTIKAGMARMLLSGVWF